ncbi:hypothetical protein [Thermomonospora umbrina]|uniref:Mce-associated membrane protein n=1 Tax=Thermomonospora umbrina TaxID=111806 RepID=A0A3D9SUE2_9ACTN|nr:hypothetical protein [Thermomonospora umbrina]REE98110.1 Mce-associated membrane protein [Thermomonospora umbrina]
MKIRPSSRRDTARTVHIPVVTGLLSVAVAVLTVFTVLLGVSWWRANQAEDERVEAMRSARQTAVNLLSIDHRNVQKSLAQVQGGLTGEARDQWGTMSKDIAQTAQRTRTVSTVQDVRAGVVSMDGDSAEVIVSITALATSPEVKQGQPRYQRWRFDLTETGGRWLVSNMRLVA